MEDISALSYPVAFAAGFVSFISPCVLAVVPGYLTFISGVSFDELGARTKDVLAPTFAFVLGFSLMFTAYGASAGLIGYSFTQDQDTLNLVAGIILIVTGVAMVALPRFACFFSLRCSFCSATLTFAFVYDCPTSSFPPVQPKTQTVRTIAKRTFHAVVISCCAVE